MLKPLEIIGMLAKLNNKYKEEYEAKRAKFDKFRKAYMSIYEGNSIIRETFGLDKTYPLTGNMIGGYVPFDSNMTTIFYGISVLLKKATQKLDDIKQIDDLIEEYFLESHRLKVELCTFILLLGDKNIFKTVKSNYNKPDVLRGIKKYGNNIVDNMNKATEISKMYVEKNIKFNKKDYSNHYSLLEKLMTSDCDGQLFENILKEPMDDDEEDEEEFLEEEGEENQNNNNDEEEEGYEEEEEEEEFLEEEGEENQNNNNDEEEEGEENQNNNNDEGEEEEEPIDDSDYEEQERLQQQDTAKRLAEEEAERQRLEQEEQERLQQQATAKRLAEEAEAKRLAEAEADKKLEEEAAQYLLEEEAEAKRLEEEAEAKRLAEAEAKRQRLEQEKQERLKQEEQVRLAEEAEKKRQDEAIAKILEKVEAERQEEEAEAKRLEQEAEAKRLEEEAEAKRLEEEAEAKRLEEEAEAKRLEEEAEAKRLEEEAEAKRLEEEAEAKRLEEEAERQRLKQEEQERLKQEEQERLVDEAKRLAEEAEKKRLAEEAEAQTDKEKNEKLSKNLLYELKKKFGVPQIGGNVTVAATLTKRTITNTKLQDVKDNEHVVYGLFYAVINLDNYIDMKYELFKKIVDYISNNINLDPNNIIALMTKEDWDNKKEIIELEDKQGKTADEEEKLEKLKIKQQLYEKVHEKILEDKNGKPEASNNNNNNNNNNIGGGNYYYNKYKKYKHLYRKQKKYSIRKGLDPVTNINMLLNSISRKNIDDIDTLSMI